MRIGIPRESKAGETLVAATAKTATQLAKLGLRRGGGVRAPAPTPTSPTRRSPTPTSPSARPTTCGPATSWSRSTPPPTTRSPGSGPGATVISLMAPARSPELVEPARRPPGVTALAMDAVPRISRAQSMDVLSSMANVAGYRAVIEAAHEFGRQFTGQVTAAGKVPAGAGLRGRRRRRRAGGDRRRGQRWARSCAPSTSAPRSPSRSSRWVRSSSRSTWSRRSAPTATPRR